MPQRILVVEDDADSRALVQLLLERAGYLVVTAGNGLEALAAARTERPDLIVLDLMMPLMDGRGFRAAQLSDPLLAAVPVVLTTASSVAIRDGVGLPVDATFLKPIDFESFMSTVRTIVERPCAA